MIFPYALYGDSDAFEVHLYEKHLVDFSTQTADWVYSYRVARQQRVEPLAT